MLLITRRRRPSTGDLLHLSIALTIVIAAVPAASHALEIWVNCGGDSLTALNTHYQADQPYAPDDFGYVGGEPWEDNYYPLGGTARDLWPLYQTGRRDFEAYRFDVPDDDYVVTIGLNELEFHGPGFRSFHVVIEGDTVLTDYDHAAFTSNAYVVRWRWPVTITDGTLDISAPAVLGAAQVSVIGVKTHPHDSIPPSPPADLIVRDSYGRVLLDWAEDFEADLQGFNVYRLPFGGGPLELLTPAPTPLHRYLDDDIIIGQSTLYQVTAVDVFGNESGAEIGTGRALPVDSSELKILDLTISAEDLYTLNSNIYGDEYVPAVFEIQGMVIDAEVRYRGASTRRGPKKNFKVKLPTLVGARDRFNINSEYGDVRMIRNKLGFDFFAGYTPTPLADWIHLRVNDHFAGVYSEIENMDDHFLVRNGLNPDASMYKAAHHANLSVLPTLEDYQIRYEKKTGPESYDDLIAFIEFLNFAGEDTFADSVGCFLDVDEFLDYYATAICIGKEGYIRENYYLYNDLPTDRWIFLPWDNSSMKMSYIPLDLGTSQHPSVDGVNVLFDRMMSTPVFRYAHAQRILNILDHRLNLGFMSPLVSGYHDSLTFDADRDFWKYEWEGNTRFHWMEAQFGDFVVNRRDYIFTNIYDLMPELGGAGALFVNELMADNESTLADEHGDYDDWIEIYNRAGATLHLGGMFLSDDAGNSTRWEFPDTAIAPGGFLLVWADDEPEQGPLHTSFRLSSGGEAVLIYDILENGNALIDSLTFPALGADQAFGRFPDGAPGGTVLDPPTPGASNVPAPNQPPAIADVEWTPEIPDPEEAVAVTCDVSDDHVVVSVFMWVSIGGGPSAPIPMADDGENGDGGAGDGVYGGEIPGADMGILVSFHIEATDDSAAVTVAPPGAPLFDRFAYLVGYRPPPLYLNELLASNDQVLPDEFGEFDDWLEIFNSSPSPLSLAGMYLSDDLSNRRKWALPDTAIPPGGFLLIWADDDPEQGPLHTSFKLDADGEELGLFDSEATGRARIDSVSWGPQTTDVSYGRQSDGGQTWVYFPTPTPGATNGTQTGLAAAPAPPPAGFRLGPSLPNPCRGLAMIPFELSAATFVELCVYDVRGSLIRRLLDGRLEDGRHRVRWDGLDSRGASVASGVYFIEMRVKGDGRTGGRLRSRLVLLR